MRDSSEKTVRPVSEHFYNKDPEDAAFYMSRHEKQETVIDENLGSDVEKTDVAPVYDRKPKHYEPANDEEKAMDKKLNFKLDFIVIVICAINFVVSIDNVLRLSKWSNDSTAPRN
jgi:uroporphyrinogen-III synthase